MVSRKSKQDPIQGYRFQLKPTLVYTPPFPWQKEQHIHCKSFYFNMHSNALASQTWWIVTCYYAATTYTHIFYSKMQQCVVIHQYNLHKNRQDKSSQNTNMYLQALQLGLFMNHNKTGNIYNACGKPLTTGSVRISVNRRQCWVKLLLLINLLLSSTTCLQSLLSQNVS